MCNEKLNKYNTAVRRAMSDKYVECTKKKSEVSNRIVCLMKKLNDGMDTLSYREYNGLLNEKVMLDNEYELLKIQINIWDQAREICMDLADEML